MVANPTSTSQVRTNNHCHLCKPIHGDCLRKKMKKVMIIERECIGHLMPNQIVEANTGGC
jgi:hypothetical protein